MSFEVPRPRDDARALDGARPSPRRGELDLPDDAMLLKRLREGDEDAFLALVRAQHAGLVRTAYGYAHRADLADALARDAWTSFLEGLPRLDLRASSVRGHLFRALITLARARVRKLRRPPPLQPASDAPLAPQRFVPDGETWAGHWARPPRPFALDDPALGSRARALLSEAVDALPEREREVLSLCDVEALSTTEAAHALALGEAGVRMALDRARARLRERLEVQG